MTQHFTPDLNQPNPPIPSTPMSIPTQSNPQHHRTIDIRPTRLILIVIITICFCIFIKNPDTVQTLGFVATLLSTQLVESLLPIIDHSDRWLINLAQWLPRLVTHLPAIRRYKSFLSHLLLTVVIFFLVFTLLHPSLSSLAGSTNDYFCLDTHLPWPLCNPGIGITALDGINVGLIMTDRDNGPFDQSRMNDQEKYIESLIFKENSTACIGRHITIVVATMLSRTIEDPSDSATVGLENLQGAYLAQKDYNHGQHLTSLCLAIANLGTVATTIDTLPQVLQRIIQFARYNSSFRGIVGFPFSSQALNALAILQPQQRTYPIISPSATSNQLSDEENFYRVAPPDLRQGAAIAQLICTYQTRLLNNQEPPVVDILSDSPDAYSSSLSQSFEDEIEKCPTYIPVYHDSYQTNDSTSIQTAADHAIEKHYPFIFFPGYFSDQDALEEEIQRKLLSIFDRSSSNVTIFSGDGLDDFANANHNTFATIYSTAYTFPLKNDISTDMKFTSEYEKTHSSLPPLEHVIPSYTLLPLDAIRSYNAMTAFTSTLKLLAARHIDPTQNNLNTSLSNIMFDGIEAHFSFHGNDKGSGHISDPEDIPLHLMCTDHTRTVHLVATYNTNDTLEMEQGKGLGLCS